MPRYFFIPVLLLVASCPPASVNNSAAGDNTAALGVHLSCFSVAPPENPQHWMEQPSCNALCAKKGAACTGVELVDPGALHIRESCADAPIPLHTEFRCCAVAR
jgi:hypothetical protein